jgi:hypothetical protein
VNSEEEEFRKRKIENRKMVGNSEGCRTKIKLERKDLESESRG